MDMPIGSDLSRNQLIKPYAGSTVSSLTCSYTLCVLEELYVTRSIKSTPIARLPGRLLIRCDPQQHLFQQPDDFPELHTEHQDAPQTVRRPW